MQPLSIVPNFDIFEDGRAGPSMGGKLPICTHFFRGGDEALHGGVVIAIANPAHAGLTMMGGQMILIGMAGVLFSLIGVMHPARGGMSAS